MRQQRLSAWLSVRPSVQHLVLDASREARFLAEAPPTPMYEHVTTTSIRFPDGGHHLLDLWRHRRCGQSAPFEARPRVTDKSFLVSLLQKAVRRSNADSAVSAAHELVHFHASSLVRRLVVIAVEDVCIDAHAPTLVFYMMCLARHILLNEDDVDWLMHYARALALHVRRDEEGPTDDVRLGSSFHTWQAASQRGDSVSLALIARAAYGGMDGDIRLLLGAAAVDNREAPSLVAWPSPRTIPPRLTMGLVILDAVDFHCEPRMLVDLARQYRVSVDRIRAAIWTNASCINVRKRPTPSEAPLYEMILTSLRQWQVRRVKHALLCLHGEEAESEDGRDGRSDCGV